MHRFGECHSRGSLTTSAREMVRGTHPTLAEVANSVLCDAKEKMPVAYCILLTATYPLNTYVRARFSISSPSLAGLDSCRFL